jgi:hypothetical protein
MKTLVFYYHESYLNITNYEHNKIYDEDVFELARKIYDMGFNVMIKHRLRGVDILYIDKGSFHQR